MRRVHSPTLGRSAHAHHPRVPIVYRSFIDFSSRAFLSFFTTLTFDRFDRFDFSSIVFHCIYRRLDSTITFNNLTFSLKSKLEKSLFTFDRFERFDFSSIVFHICRRLDSCIYVRFSRLHVNVKMFLKFSELEKSLFDVYFRSND